MELQSCFTHFRDFIPEVSTTTNFPRYNFKKLNMMKDMIDKARENKQLRDEILGTTI